jgi:glycosyltransferase involved in cell wall biosynthesis
MKIAIFTPTFLPKCSGAEIFHHNLAREFAAMGHQPIVIIPRFFQRRLPPSLPYRTIGFPANIWSYFKYSPSVAFFINRRALDSLQRRYRFNVWHTVVLSPSGVCFANWQFHRGIPGLIRAVGDDVQPVVSEKRERCMRSLVQEWIPRAQKIVSLSLDMSLQLEELGVPRNKIEIIPNAVDFRRFSARVDKYALRQKNSLPSDAFIFLCVARNHPQKDFPTLLSAFQKVLESNSKRNFHLLIVGRGVLLLSELLMSLGIQKNVTLKEVSTPTDKGIDFPPQELVDSYHLADAFVLASLLEGFSSALLEAMAAGLPVVATNAPGIVDQVKNDIHGLLSECRSVDQFAASMLTIANEKDRYAFFSKNASSTAKEFSWRQTAEKYLVSYDKVIRQSSECFI